MNALSPSVNNNIHCRPIYLIDWVGLSQTLVNATTGSYSPLPNVFVFIIINGTKYLLLSALKLKFNTYVIVVEKLYPGITHVHRYHWDFLFLVTNTSRSFSLLFFPAPLLTAHHTLCLSVCDYLNRIEVTKRMIGNS